jgi:hypothetical protein
MVNTVTAPPQSRPSTLKSITAVTATFLAASLYISQSFGKGTGIFS